MNVEFVLGKAKTGKSKYIYESINRDIQNGKQVILFVPSQMRLVAETNYMKELNQPGVINLNITTISVYISECIKANNLHIEDKYISKLDRKILLTQVLNENSDSFKVFSKVKNKQGFLDMLNIYMDLFRKESINTQDIYSISIKDKLLETKLKEITYIYEKYLEKIQGKYIDNIDEIDMYISALCNSRINIENTAIYFDGYNNFSNSELKFLQEVFRQNIDVTITLDTDISCVEDIYATNSQEIFETVNKTYVNLLKIIDKAHGSVFNKVLSNNEYFEAKHTIKYLSQNIFDINAKVVENVDNSVHLNIFSNVYDEISNIAKVISQKILDGYRYNDFAIYTTNVNSYYNLISRIFYEYKIPVYASSKQFVESSKLCSYISHLLDVGVSNIQIESVLDILKLGLNDISREDIYELENYAREFNINKYSLKYEFKYNNSNRRDKVYDVIKLNDIRTRTLDIFETFQTNLKSANSVKDIISHIYEHLTQNHIFENYSSYLTLGQSNSYLINYTLIEAQVWGKICEVMNSIAKIYDQNIDVVTFKDIFKNSIKDVSLKSIPPTLDQIELLDINGAKTTTKKCIFFVGVNENSFPKKVDEDIFFSDFELEKLQSKDVNFKETSISKINMQLFNIYQALSNVTQDIYMSVPATDFSGKSLRQSNLINLVKKVVDTKLIGDIAKDGEQGLSLDGMYSNEKAFDEMINFFRNAKDDEKQNKNAISIYEYFLDKKRFVDILNYAKRDDNLEDETIEMLYSDNLRTSISKLELFKKCPFSYYIEYGLNIQPRKEFQITSMDIGSFMHAVVESFSKYLLLNKIAWQEVIDIDENLKVQFKEILFKVIEEELENCLSKQKESIKYSILKRKLLNTMQKVITVIARSFNQSDFVPFGYEIEFKENGIFAPIEIKLDNDKYMRLVGKIDRIDVLKTENEMYARVVDYKSSSRTLELDDIKEGLSLQLVSYLTAFIENTQKSDKMQVLPAAMLYFNLSDSLVNLSKYTKDEVQIEKEIIEKLRMKGIFLNNVTLLEKMDHKLNEQSRIIDISKRSLTAGSKKALEQEQFVSLCKEAKTILKQIGEQVLKGVVKIEPNKKADHCKYCNYSSVCRKNSCV